MGWGSAAHPLVQVGGLQIVVLLRGGGISPAFPAAGGGEECVYPLRSGVPWGVVAAWVGAVGGANYNSQKALREGALPRQPISARAAAL